MNVANLELCKELYELSGWKDTYFGYLPSRSLPVHTTKQAYEVPLYDSGYLLRKLPANTPSNDGFLRIEKIQDNWYQAMYKHENLAINPSKAYDADTPEDALCKLAIELFKQNTLKREA